MSETTPTRRFFSGTSLERAILEAAGHYGLEPEQLAYSKQEKRGVSARGKVVIRVDPKQPRRVESAEPAPTTVQEQPEAVAEVDSESATEEAKAESESDANDITVDQPMADQPESAGTVANAGPAEDAGGSAVSSGSTATDGAGDAGETEEPSAPDAVSPAATTSADGELKDLPQTSAEARRGWEQATGPIEQAARKWTESLLRVASLDLEVEIYQREGELEVHLGGADAEVAVEDGGEVLRAIQHLLPRLMLGTVGESVPCRVDCNDFRELHDERLRAQALSAAAEAMAERGEITLDPMHPADRRIIHLALADNELLRTESLGRGFFKRVSIRCS